MFVGITDSHLVIYNYNSGPFITILGDGTILESNEHIDTCPKVIEIQFIVGLIKLDGISYLITCTESKTVGQIEKHKIQQVTNTMIIPVIKSIKIGKKEKQQIDMINLMLQLPSLYYSFTYDLTISIYKNNINSNTEDNYIWNYNLKQPFLSQNLGNWVQNIIFGFIAIESGCNINGNVFNYSLISRRNRLYSGTRFWRRGIDNDGNAANFVETEQIIECNDKFTSFTQIRGSIPCNWKQIPNLHPVPPVHISDTDMNVNSAVHFKKLQQKYENIVCVCLVKHKGAELELFNTYEHIAKKLNIPMVDFDLHAMCPGTNFSKLEILKENILPYIENFNLTMFDDNDIYNKQTGVVRTNCLDNLDRTNLVQSYIANIMMNRILRQFNVLTYSETIDDYSTFNSIFKNIWADHADIISTQYCGTGALNTLFTRTGKTNKIAFYKDKFTSARRYYQNNFCDGYKQDAYDLFLGNITYSTYHNSIKFVHYPIIILSSILLFNILFCIWVIMPNQNLLLFLLFLILLITVTIVMFNSQIQKGIIDFPQFSHK